MAPSSPRIRMIAGPNGSGKSTIRELIPEELIVVFVNADEIAKQLKSNGSFDFSKFGIKPTKASIVNFYLQSAQLKKAGIPISDSNFLLKETLLIVRGIPDFDYLAAATADFVRSELIDAKRSFTFETVMSHPSKLKIFETALERGYRTYLYFVGTADVELNLDRIQDRVESGGHDVNSDLVKKRYVRSMSQLYDAIQLSNRAFVFDNSGELNQTILVAEFEEGKIRSMAEDVPDWFYEYYVVKSDEVKLVD